MSTKPTNVLPVGTEPDTDTFQVESLPPQVGFLKRAVQPPSDVYVETSDVLVVGVATSQRQEVLTVSYRLLRFDGVLVHGQFTISPPPTRAITTHSEQLAEGFLMSMSCKAAVATERGQTFARAFLTKPSLGAGQPSYMLMADYVTTAMAPAFPNGRVSAPVEGSGWRNTVVVAPPGAGINWTSGPPPNTRWRLDCAFVGLSTNATVADRRAGILLAIGGAFPFFGWAEQTIPANTGAGIQFSKTRNVPIAASEELWVPLPIDCELLAGNIISGTTVNMDPGDAYSSVTLSVEEWLDNV